MRLRSRECILNIPRLQCLRPIQPRIIGGSWADVQRRAAFDSPFEKSKSLTRSPYERVLLQFLGRKDSSPQKNKLGSAATTQISRLYAQSKFRSQFSLWRFNSTIAKIYWRVQRAASSRVSSPPVILELSCIGLLNVVLEIWHSNLPEALARQLMRTKFPPLPCMVAC
jgi:hypothetical protein